MKSSAITKKKKTIRKGLVKENAFPIVAIGASTGGLEAVSQLLEYLPPDTGMAYIYVQHISPDHKSALPQILARRTKMKVEEIDDMEHIAPDNLYVIPYNKEIKVIDGHIQLLPRRKTTPVNVSIDILFSSLAVTHKENVVGVILSGNAMDGTIGLKAIKDAGGMTFTQDDSAQAGSMPKSAIESGVVDFVLSPKEIALELAKLNKNGILVRDGKGKGKSNLSVENNADLKSVFELLHKETGVDFSHYKMPTIRRRLNNRMVQAGVKTIKQYISILLKEDKAVDVLYKDLLINVTGFFRDTETFKYLKENLLPKLLKSKQPDESLRIWVPACSTGEEAYSFAMLIAEIQANQLNKIPVQIFATDLSEHAIHEARVGEYSKAGMKGVSKKYMEQYFVKTGDNYRISKEI